MLNETSVRLCCAKGYFPIEKHRGGPESRELNFSISQPLHGQIRNGLPTYVFIP